MLIEYSSRFERAYQKLPQGIIKKRAERAEVIFRQNPFDPRLATHKLHGRLRSQWSFSVDRHNRILFQFLNKARTHALFIDIGDHKIYQ